MLATGMSGTTLGSTTGGFSLGFLRGLGLGGGLRFVFLCLVWQLVLVRGLVAPGTAERQGHFGSLQRDWNEDRVRMKLSRGSAGMRQGQVVVKASSSSSVSPDAQLSPLEDWCAREVEEWYQRAASVKCPFFKRRFVDLLDGIDMVLRFLVIRHKSLGIFGPPPGHRSKFLMEEKRMDLTVGQLSDAIRSDWKEKTGMGYYITGNLNTTIFRDDCLFAGPDPDMPVQGLRKYLNAASQLFDRSKSRAEMLSLEALSNDNGKDVVVVRWRMNGVLRLPWKPKLPEWTGSTTYHFDDNGLIFLHEENWDMSVWQAFMKTFAPEMAERIWPKPPALDKEPVIGCKGCKGHAEDHDSSGQ